MNCLKTVCEECTLCKRYAPTFPRPVVSNLFDPDKMRFNQVVSLDLKEWKGQYILYLIDMVTRYTRAHFIPNKRKETVVNKIIELWLPLFGAPDQFYSDNGGEFANTELRELGEQYGIVIKHTPAYSPWANGLNERNHATVDLMLEKMLEEDPKIPKNVALQYAISVRNCFLFVNSFTPAQLAIGQNPRLPSTFHDKLPALEGETSSCGIAEHLNTIAAAMRAFTEAEISSKVRKALKHPVRRNCDIVYKQADCVFYKVNGDKRWHGEAFVVGVEGKNVLIKHGDSLKRVLPCRLHPASHSLQVAGTNSDDIKVSNNQPMTRQSLIYGSPVTDMPSDVIIAPDANLGMTEAAEADISGDVEIGDHGEENELLQNEQSDGDGPVAHVSFDDGSAPSQGQSGGTSVPVNSDSAKNQRDLPKRHDVLRYLDQSDDSWKKVKVLGPAGKKTGGNRSWVNVQDEHNCKYSLDLESVEDWEVAANIDEVLVVSNHDGFSDAKLEELERWKEFDAFEEVENVGQKYITGCWVCNRKESDGKLVNRAWYVIRGFQEDASIQSDSPTGSKEGMRLALSVIACKGWRVNIIDIKSAFLQGKSLERDIFVVPPKEANTINKLWKLKKGIYGLNDAARMWYFAVSEELTQLSCHRSSTDYGIFTWYEENELQGILMSHVDDFLWAGTEAFHQSVIVPLSAKFKVGKSSSSDSFQYVGINISQGTGGISIDQYDYIDSMNPINVSRQKQVNKNMMCNAEETSAFCRLVGKLNWVANQTRPDILFDIC